MSSKTNKYLVFLGISAVLLANTALSFAQDGLESFKLSSDFEDSNVQIEKEIEQKTPTVEQEEFLKRVKNELNLTKTDYRQTLNSLSDAQKRLHTLHEEKLDLQEQLENVDAEIAINQEQLFRVIGQIVEIENQMKVIYEEIELREVAMDYQKSLIQDYIKVIYEEENQYLEIGPGGSIETFKLLLSDGKISENLSQIKYFDLLSETGGQLIDKLEKLSKELEGYKMELDKRKEKLDVLKTRLDQEKNELELRRESKERLLTITSGQEEIYQQLLEQTIEQQAELVDDLKHLSEAVDFIESKLKEEGANFDIRKYESLLDYKTKALYEFQINSLGSQSDGFLWPVAPDRGISAHFRDPGYAGSFGVQHNAIDIPEYQGTPVRSAADGVVYAAKDNGYGYSYIVIAHAGGFNTVYGHMSSILVSEGQTVGQGSIIGLSGGMPGTKGAGYMTTGPHLHFEMLLNGVYVDPLQYLPLDILTQEQIEKLPEKYHDDWEKAVLEEAEALSRF